LGLPGQNDAKGSQRVGGAANEAKSKAVKPATINGVQIAIPDDCEVVRVGDGWTVVRTGIVGKTDLEALSEAYQNVRRRYERTNLPCNDCGERKPDVRPRGALAPLCSACAADFDKWLAQQKAT
jgi:hypothetical protein